MDRRSVWIILACWHTHSNNFEGTSRQAVVLHQAMDAMLSDLQVKALLAQTPVILATEFGRTLQINDKGGLAGRTAVPVTAQLRRR